MLKYVIEILRKKKTFNKNKDRCLIKNISNFTLQILKRDFDKHLIINLKDSLKFINNIFFFLL